MGQIRGQACVRVYSFPKITTLDGGPTLREPVAVLGDEQRCVRDHGLSLPSLPAQVAIELADQSPRQEHLAATAAFGDGRVQGEPGADGLPVVGELVQRL